ncbi:hypothetical protein ES705_17753 [subsurface metagenome]
MQESIQVSVNWLPRVEEALRVEGFGTGLQIWKSGQRSGWIKAIDGGYQMHVRLFSNGIIQPEYEIHWQFIEHPNTSWSAIEAMKSVLGNYSVPYLVTYTEPYTENGMLPTSRTPWLGALAVFLLGLVIIKGLSNQEA